MQPLIENVAFPYYEFLLLPHSRRPNAYVYFRKELVRFKRTVEDFTGKELTDTALKEAIRVYNESRTLLKKAYDLSSDSPFYVMQLYRGSLRNLLRPGIPTGKVLNYFANILDGVEAAHLQKTIIWRDSLPRYSHQSTEGGRLWVVSGSPFRVDYVVLIGL